MKLKQIADRFFRWYCRPEYYEDIRGDLDELFEEHLQDARRLQAELQYMREVLLLLRPSLIKGINPLHLMPSRAMIKTNTNLAVRHMWKHKFSSFIKLSGFTVAITACLLLALFLQHELNYDTQHPDRDRIYRAVVHYQKDGVKGVDFPAPFSAALKSDFAEIEETSRFISASWLHHVRTAQQVKNTYEVGFAYADHELVNILKLPMVLGDPTTVLNRPNTLIISKRKADKHFGDVHPIGQTLFINDDQARPYEVVGVFDDRPSNTHLQFDFLLSLEGVEFWPGEQEYWGASMYMVYLQLRKDADATQLENKLHDIATNYFLPSFRAREFADPVDMAQDMQFLLQPINEIYLNKASISDGLNHGDVRLYWLLGISGLLILVIACINFINLSTARASVRAKEIGIRKVVGATQGHLTHQFITESVLYCLISFIVGITLTWLCLPYVNSIIAPKSLAFSADLLQTIPLLFGGLLVIALASGIFPSLHLASMNTIFSIKGASGTPRLHRSARSITVVFQFAASVVLIACTFVVYQQMQFILNKQVGFDKDQVLIVHGSEMLGDKVSVFKEELLRYQGIEKVAASDYLPIEGTSRYHDSFWNEGKQSIDDGVGAQIWSVDYDYIPTLGIQLLEGRNFSQIYASDSSAIVLSKRLAERLGLDEPLGAYITNKVHTWQVVGVMEDFHFESLRSALSPASLVIGTQSSTLSIRYSTENREELLQVAENLWNTFVTTAPFRYEFLDSSFAKMHEDVQQSATLFNGFSILAIFLSCLGLFGLMAFITEQRTREIGIRKVLGATAGTIVVLLSRDFVRPVLLSILIGAPIAWFAMRTWLDGFVYRTELGIWIFVLAGGATFLIAILTISIHSVRTALANPIASIKNGSA